MQCTKVQGIECSALTAVKDHVVKFSETVLSNSSVNYFMVNKTLMTMKEFYWP